MENPTCMEELDDVMCDYICWLYEEDLPKSRADNALYGTLVFVRGSRGLLHYSYLSLRGWTRLRPPTSHTPMTWNMAVVVAWRLAAMGQWRIAVGVLVMFDGLLRIGWL